jgi:predicted dehydrogenase
MRVQYGDIGRIVFAEAAYHCNAFWKKPGIRRDTVEERLRAWAYDRVFSGDIITEQNIHALDVATWILDAEPESARGQGGHKTNISGDCADHLALIYKFPNQLLCNFSATQFKQHYDDIVCRVFGEDGHIDTHYFTTVGIRGNVPYKGGDVGSLFTDSVVKNIATFYDSITGDQFENPTVAPSVRSNLTTVLGRLAAASSREVTWQAMLADNQKLDADLRGLKS